MSYIWDFRLRLIGLEFETRIYLLNMYNGPCNWLILVYVVSWYTLGTTCKFIRPSSHEESLSNRARNYFA